MSKPEQIGIIGISHIFIPPVTADLCHEPRLYGTEVLLYDINQQRSKEAAIVCTRYAGEIGADIRFRAVTDLRAAIVDSSFVLQTALAGGRERGDAIKQAVAKATGIYGPVEAHAPYAQLKLMLDIADEIQRLSPDATLIQCANNPIPEGGTLVTQETGIRFIGVCHGYKEWEHLARVMGMNPDLAEVKIAGINHNVWLLEFLYENKDAYPRLDEWIRETSDHWLKTFLPYAKNVDYQLSRAAFDLYRRLGVMPIGDTTRASSPNLSCYGYHDSPQAESYFFGNEQGFESVRGESKSRNWRTKSIEAFAQAAGDPTMRVQHLFPRNSGWQIVPIIASMATDQPSRQMVNVPNNGAIAGLEDRLVVEIPAMVNAQGTHTDGVIQIPPLLFQEILLPRQKQALYHVDAYRLRKEELLLQVLMDNHKIQRDGGGDAASSILNIWKSFDPEMASHYAI